MSAKDFGLQWLASEALAALDAYESSMREVVGNWLDMEAYTAASQELDRIRSCISGVPGLAAPWVTVLISHTELVHALWHCEREKTPIGENEHQALADHLVVVHHLQRRCRRLAGPVRPH
jgi:hypothetical protein